MVLHDGQRSHWFREFYLQIISGVVYGVSNTLIGHPLDTVKTKMQAQKGYDGNMIQEIKHVYKADGFKGFFRGVLPPLWGSSIYRSMQFGVFEAFISKCDHDIPSLCTNIPGTSVQWKILLGGILGGTARSIIETPIEYAKVKRQTNQKWEIRKIFTGFSQTYYRSTGIMTTFFILMDQIRKKTTWLQSTLGQFLSGGLCATFAFQLFWPFEVLKNHVQSGKCQSNNMWQYTREIGLTGLYRGILPGSLSICMRNGGAMLAMQTFNKHFMNKIRNQQN